MTRATEVQVVIISKGMERGVVALITELFERIAAIEKNVTDGALLQLETINQLSKVVDGAGNLRKEIERLRSHTREDDDDLPPMAS